MRAWLLTNTTYGTWLPGSERGSVTSVRDRRPYDDPTPVRIEHALPGEAYEDEIPALARAAREQLQGPPIHLDREQAEHVLAQFQETAAFRQWSLRAVAIMHNHYHLVVVLPEDPPPRKILADFKAYATRWLNCVYGERPSGTWWTSSGSKRKLKDDAALAAAIHYVLYEQPNPLVVWSP